MSSNTQNTPTQNNNQTPTQPREEPNQNNQEEKPATCIRSFFRSYLFYFFLATGTAFSSYMVYKRMNRN